MIDPWAVHCTSIGARSFDVQLHTGVATSKEDTGKDTQKARGGGEGRGGRGKVAFQKVERKEFDCHWAVVVCAFNPSTWEVQAGGFCLKLAWSTE